jgi:hypothetical protein
VDLGQQAKWNRRKKEEIVYRKTPGMILPLDNTAGGFPRTAMNYIYRFSGSARDANALGCPRHKVVSVRVLD